jgi:glycosyltransferase involved in cell wall biosynthesis
MVTKQSERVFGEAADKDLDGLSAVPPISVLIPCYNEEKFIGPCIESVMCDFVLANCEILVIDGRSTDKTREVISSLAARHPIIRLLDNPDRLQAAGMNVGIKAARGATVVRLDAHSTYQAGHVERCRLALERTDAANVGGVMVPVGSGMVQESVARAMAHPAGIGGSKFHLDNFSGYSDTAYLGTFRREILERLGGYDPDSHPAEDAELNCRILELGERVYLDSSIRVDYRPRDTFRRLMKQFFWYGRGRCYVMLKHRRIFTAARFAPPALVLSLIASVILAAFDWKWLLLPLAYAIALLILGGLLWRGERRSLRHVFVQAAVLGTMHLAYGTGFLLKLVHVLR